MAPTILFVPGIWEGASLFGPISSLLAADGFTTATAVLPSTATTSPGNPTMKDDVAAVRYHIQQLVHRGDDILLVLHSAGGFIGSEAMEGLAKKERQERGERGGVIGIVFIAGAVFPVGHQHHPLPFAVIEVDTLVFLVISRLLIFVRIREGPPTVHSPSSCFSMTSPKRKRQNGWLNFGRSPRSDGMMWCHIPVGRMFQVRT